MVLLHSIVDLLKVSDVAHVETTDLCNYMQKDPNSTLVQTFSLKFWWSFWPRLFRFHHFISVQEITYLRWGASRNFTFSVLNDDFIRESAILSFKK